MVIRLEDKLEGGGVWWCYMILLVSCLFFFFFSHSVSYSYSYSSMRKKVYTYRVLEISIPFSTYLPSYLPTLASYLSINL